MAHFVISDDGRRFASASLPFEDRGLWSWREGEQPQRVSASQEIVTYTDRCPHGQRHGICSVWVPEWMISWQSPYANKRCVGVSPNSLSSPGLPFPHGQTSRRPMSRSSILSRWMSYVSWQSLMQTSVSAASLICFSKKHPKLSPVPSRPARKLT